MRVFILVLLLTTWIRCSDTNPKTKTAQAAPVIAAIDAGFPLELSAIDLGDEANLVHLNDGINAAIVNTIKDYYDSDCLPDSLHTYADTYISSIRLRDSLHTIFLVLLKHYPSEELASRVLFYDNEKKEFIDETLDFRIYALYELENGHLKPTDLKINYNIAGPEIQRVDFDKDGINDFKFTRLFHKGTFNTIQEAIVTIKDSRIDTLFFEERPPGAWLGE